MEWYPTSDTIEWNGKTFFARPHRRISVVVESVRKIGSKFFLPSHNRTEIHQRLLIKYLVHNTSHKNQHGRQPLSHMVGPSSRWCERRTGLVSVQQSTYYSILANQPLGGKCVIILFRVIIPYLTKQKFHVYKTINQEHQVILQKSMKSSICEKYFSQVRTVQVEHGFISLYHRLGSQNLLI